MSRLSDLMRKLSELEEAQQQARQEDYSAMSDEDLIASLLSSPDPDAPGTDITPLSDRRLAELFKGRQRPVFLPSSSFNDKTEMDLIRNRLEDAGAAHVVEYHLVRSDGTYAWKGTRADDAPERANTPDPSINAAAAPLSPSPGDGEVKTQLHTPDPAPVDETTPPATGAPLSREEWLKEIAPRYPEHRIRKEPLTNENDPPPKPEKDISWMSGGPAEPEPRRRRPGEIQYERVPISGIEGGK